MLEHLGKMLGKPGISLYERVTGRDQYGDLLANAKQSLGLVPVRSFGEDVERMTAANPEHYHNLVAEYLRMGFTPEEARAQASARLSAPADLMTGGS